MKKLTREMLLIEPSNKYQLCRNCPFLQNGKLTCTLLDVNADLADQIDIEFVSKGNLACNTHSITIKPEYDGLD